MSESEGATMAADQSGAGRSETLPEMTLLGHLTELRRRLIVSLVTFVIGMVVCWAFAADIYSLLTRPIVELLPSDERPAYLSLTEPFILYLKVAALSGFLVASPVIIYQVWMFVAPGLYRRERHYAFPGQTT